MLSGYLWKCGTYTLRVGAGWLRIGGQLMRVSVLELESLLRGGEFWFSGVDFVKMSHFPNFFAINFSINVSHISHIGAGALLFLISVNLTIFGGWVEKKWDP